MLTFRTMLITMLAIALSACAAGPSGQTFDSPIGEWKTRTTGPNGGASLALAITDRGEGTYEYLDGTLYFDSIDDETRTWEGIWTESYTESWARGRECNTSKNGRDAWGAVQFQFNETYNAFEGSWDYCGQGDSWQWNGYR